ncbi:Histone H1.2 [Raphanus sativus]|uniref:Histone H1.2-like n=1 Tax=Raphanus sativus TaxID=3726 RepID=A0A6J0MRN7_RAPSA|nr:histone H1.2-like [Raphanus sativus]KAJ4868467.1 Histone H1.2 [Raphanus sativus]
MSAEEETLPTNVESGDAEVASEKQPTAKGGKAKITKEVKAMTKAPKKKTSSSHPTYEEMIKDAITTLKERTGSSQYAIQKFIEEKEKSLPPTFRKLLLVNLKRLVAAEKLVKVKGSFKLSSAKPAASAPVNKEPEAKASKKPAAAKPKAKERPIKASRTSSRTSPEKKAADAETAVVAAEKKDLPAKREFINWTFPYL